jgi:hypothetical protein
MIECADRFSSLLPLVSAMVGAAAFVCSRKLDRSIRDGEQRCVDALADKRHGPAIARVVARRKDAEQLALGIEDAGAGVAGCACVARDAQERFGCDPDGRVIRPRNEPRALDSETALVFTPNVKLSSARRRFADESCADVPRVQTNVVRFEDGEVTVGEGAHDFGGPWTVVDPNRDRPVVGDVASGDDSNPPGQHGHDDACANRVPVRADVRRHDHHRLAGACCGIRRVCHGRYRDRESDRTQDDSRKPDSNGAHPTPLMFLNAADYRSTCAAARNSPKRSRRRC